MFHVQRCRVQGAQAARRASGGCVMAVRSASTTRLVVARAAMGKSSPSAHSPSTSFGGRSTAATPLSATAASEGAHLRLTAAAAATPRGSGISSQRRYSRSSDLHTRPQQCREYTTFPTTSDSNGSKQNRGSSSSKSKRLPLDSPIANVSSLDHLVLTVRSLEASIKWYTSVLGMRHVMFDTAAPSSTSSTSTPSPSAPSTDSSGSSSSTRRHALSFNNQKINLHESGREFEPKAASPAPGSADLCFIVSEDVEGLPARLDAAGVQVLWHTDEKVGSTTAASSGSGGEGEKKTAVVTRTGARGTLRSVYLRDPDGNLIELSNYKTTRDREDTEGHEDEYEEKVKAEAENEEEGVIPTPS